MSATMFLLLKKSADRRQHEALEAAFKAADVNGDGYLSADQYYHIMKEHGVNCSKEEILHLMQVADKDGDGRLSKEEFLGEGGHKSLFVTSTKRDPAPVALGVDEKVDLAFKAFDRDRDGFVTKEDMLSKSKKMTKEQVDAVFLMNDEDQDGRLNREEFHEFMHQHMQKKKSS